MMHVSLAAGRPPRWFMGNLGELRASGPARVHQRWAQEYGPVFTSFGGSQPFVFTDQPELVRQVLIQHTARPAFPSIWLGAEREFDKASILAIRGEKHRSIRGAWTPMFFSGRCTVMLPAMQPCNPGDQHGK